MESVELCRTSKSSETSKDREKRRILNNYNNGPRESNHVKC